MVPMLVASVTLLRFLPPPFAAQFLQIFLRLRWSAAHEEAQSAFIWSDAGPAAFEQNPFGDAFPVLIGGVEIASFTHRAHHEHIEAR